MCIFVKEFFRQRVKYSSYVEMGLQLVCFWNSKMVNMIGVECVKRRMIEVREEVGGQIMEDFERFLFFNLNEIGKYQRILRRGVGVI